MGRMQGLGLVLQKAREQESVMMFGREPYKNILGTKWQAQDGRAQPFLSLDDGEYVWQRWWEWGLVILFFLLYVYLRKCV